VSPAPWRSSEQAIIDPCVANAHARQARSRKIGYLRRLARSLATQGSITMKWLFATDDAVQLGGFDESLRRANDYHLWVRLAMEADLWFVPKILALYRQHEGNITKSPGPPRDSTLRALRRLLCDPAFVPYRRAIRSRMASFLRSQGAYFRQHGSFLRASRSYAHSIASAPGKPRGWLGLAATMIRRP